MKVLVLFISLLLSGVLSASEKLEVYMGMEFSLFRGENRNQWRRLYISTQDEGRARLSDIISRPRGKEQNCKDQVIFAATLLRELKVHPEFNVLLNNRAINNGADIVWMMLDIRADEDFEVEFMRLDLQYGTKVRTEDNGTRYYTHVEQIHIPLDESADEDDVKDEIQKIIDRLKRENARFGDNLSDFAPVIQYRSYRN